MPHLHGGFFKFIKEQDAVGPLAQKRRKNAWFSARKRADEPFKGIAGLIFRQIQTEECFFASKKRSSERFCGFCFSHSRRTEKEKRTERPAGVCKPRAGASERGRNGRESFALSDDALPEFCLKRHKDCALSFRERADGYAGPLLNNRKNIGG